MAMVLLIATVRRAPAAACPSVAETPPEGLRE
jgi:hypothetical protein